MLHNAATSLLRPGSKDTQSDQVRLSLSLYRCYKITSCFAPYPVMLQSVQFWRDVKAGKLYHAIWTTSRRWHCAAMVDEMAYKQQALQAVMLFSESPPIQQVVVAEDEAESKVLFWQCGSTQCSANTGESGSRPAIWFLSWTELKLYKGVTSRFQLRLRLGLRFRVRARVGVVYTLSTLREVLYEVRASQLAQAWEGLVL